MTDQTRDTITLPDGRVMSREEYRQAWEKLRAPFPKEQIELKPQAISKNDRDRYQCRKGTKASVDGRFCGGYHSRSIHLDYVGHAGVTERLNEADPFWTIDFAAHDPQTGAPIVDRAGTWFTMTVLGVTRPCIGDAGADGRAFGGLKEVIGDAIRNGAMRFGVATYLWSKSEAAAARREWTEDDTPPAPAASAPESDERPRSGTNTRQGPPNAAGGDAGPNWPESYRAAYERGPQHLEYFLRWAEQNGGPAEMIRDGREELARTQPIEGTVES